MYSILNDSQEIVDLLKKMTAAHLTQLEEVLDDTDTSEITNEELLNIKKTFMVEMIDSVDQNKLQIFDNVLDSYNEFLEIKHETEKEIKRQNEESAAYVVAARKDAKNTTIVSIIATVFFPTALPLIAALGISRLGFDSIQAKINLDRIKYNKKLQDEMKEIQDPFYEFTDTLRTDYHTSKRELKELKEKASNGENVIPNLKEIVNPERVNLERIWTSSELVDRPKQLIKRD